MDDSYKFGQQVISVYGIYTEEDGSQHRGDSPTLFEKRVSSLKSLVLG